MAAVVPEEEKVRARRHLGYLGVEASSTFSLGIPAAIQTQFMVEGALNRLLPQSMPTFLMLLDRLDCIDCEFYGGVDTATVSKIAEVEIDDKRIQKIGKYYRNARSDLANLLGIVPNPFDQREIVMEGGGINVPVG